MNYDNINPDIMDTMERFTKLFDGAITFKLNSNDISYIKVDNKVFYAKNVEKDSTEAFNYLMNIYKAQETVRNCDDVRNLDKDTYNFIIKYHPFWISARRMNGFSKIDNDEVGVVSDEILKTPSEWMSDLYGVIGLKMKSSIKDMNSSTLMTEDVFISTVDESIFEPNQFFKHYVHPYYFAYVAVVAIKNQIDDYNKTAGRGRKIKFISYKLDENGFPIVLITGSNKATYSYDFRNPEEREECMKWIRSTVGVILNSKPSFSKYLNKNMGSTENSHIKTIGVKSK